MKSEKPTIPKKPFWEKALYFIGLCAALAVTKNIISTIVANNVKHNHIDNTKRWSNVYTNSVYFTLFDSYDKILADSSSKSLLANCVVEKLKSKFPNELNGVIPDSIIKYTKLYGKQCSHSLVLNFIAWNAPLNSALKKILLNSPLVASMADKYKEPYCNCYLVELKKKFPDGNVDTIKSSVRDSLILVCVREIKKQFH